MEKERLGFYKADDPEGYIAVVFADLIRKGIVKDTEGLDQSVAERVKKILEEDKD